MGRELADEFGFNAGDPDAMDSFMDGIHHGIIQDRYMDRDADLETEDGEELLIPDELDDNLVTHVIGGQMYIQRGPYGVPTESPEILFYEGQYYSCTRMSDEYGDIETKVDLEWRNRKWWRLDAERLKAGGVQVVCGSLVGPDGDEPFLSDYVPGRERD